MVRKVQQSDRDNYIMLIEEFYNSDGVAHKIPSKNFRITFDKIIDSGIYADGYIFEYDGNPVGYALTAKTYSNEAGGIVIWIEEVYVKEEFRSKGLGKEFFDFIENEFDGKMKRMRLEVREDNIRAIKLYEQLGFKRFGYVPMVKEYD
jgi:ribosomal protein S18 acetylase RimI-like enzyme